MARKRRGFGRLRQLPSGRWQAAYVGPDAKLHKAPRTYASEHDAEGWLAAERRKIDLGTWGAVERSDGVTLRRYADRWIEQRALRTRTQSLYESMLERLILPELGDAKLTALTPARVREWHAGLGTKHPTRNAHAYALLHAICATAVADELLDANPCRIRAAMQTKRRRSIDVLTPVQLDALAAAMPAELCASVLLAAWCGLRWGETSELRRRDVSADHSVLHIRRAVTYRAGRFTVGEPKTAAGSRDVTVPPHLRPILAAHLREHVGRGGEALLFADAGGTHLRPDRYRAHWEKARAAIGKPRFRVHDLRHVGAVLAAQSGATTAELMHRLGHTTPQMALRYQHVGEGRDAEIARRLSKLAVAG
ncbi:putative prophage phiRv2 integrase [Mycobacterium kubicae]|uniref:Prophage phiRv2 integrase n=1 Tax=Mycobacterium kubicae TaxID=120959 RepID=A0AAX1J9G7_9MYCO|nr:site-specific integrase [Mycobacterium kubicae]MCV7095389.1 site-specific integrase [Mycobacterium kubicae]QNI13532.1 site-specific integrase [Mycobacterium kubicae]QPI37049.1 site-specific integrase [Mycobacterium kubicae]GFG66888.1 putative prophage phiRv2 integrase [Mycobacterium kubicae]